MCISPRCRLDNERSEVSVQICGCDVDIPLRKAIFYVVEGRIDEYARVIPGSRFDTNGFMDETTLRKVFVGDGNRYMIEVTATQQRMRIQHSLCLLIKATSCPSELQATYLTGGLFSSAIIFCCWIS